MKSVAVLDSLKRSQNPVHPAVARRMLKNGNAAVYRNHPFTIILALGVESEFPSPLRLKIDPGSRTTGLVIVNDATRAIVWIGELRHRGIEIKKALDKRRALRRSRRNRHTRYRPSRFDNRRKGGCHGCGGNPAKRKSLCRPCATMPRGERNPELAVKWLPPSLMSRVHNVETWARRLCSAFPITAISVEVARFDTQLIENPNIGGVEYQQGELAGYEVREYLLEKFQRKCSYCGLKDVPLEIEHIVPKSRNGSNRISNLTIACHSCNQAKGNQTAEEFGHPQVQIQVRQPLRDAAMMNATRYKTHDMLRGFGVPLETGTGGRTKYNRTRAGLEKSHWADAACVGASTPERWKLDKGTVHQIRTKSYARRGRRQVCLVNASGFPRSGAKSGVRFFGYQTGDVVQVEIPKGKNAGVHVVRLSVRSDGRFDMKPENGKMFTGSYRYIVGLMDRCGSFEYSDHTCDAK